MKLLLTSSGISNKSIARSFVKLLGKPFRKSKLLFIPTAANINPGDKKWLIKDLKNFEKLGFREIDILNIDATPEKKIWQPRVRNADVLFFGGGNAYYLAYWLRKSGLAKAMPRFLRTRVYAGISAGSIVAAKSLSLSSGKNLDLFRLYFERASKGADSNKGLGLVDFHVRPHMNNPRFPHAKVSYVKKVAEKIREPIYAIDDESAVEVDGRKIRIVSEGKFLTFNAGKVPESSL